MAKLADATDLSSVDFVSCGFESHYLYHISGTPCRSKQLVDDISSEKPSQVAPEIPLHIKIKKKIRKDDVKC